MADKSIDQLLAEINAAAAEVRAMLESIPEGAIPDKQEQETINQILGATKTAKAAIDRYNKNKAKMALNTLVVRYKNKRR